MKKQLIVLTTLFVAGSSQCNIYSDAATKAKTAIQQAQKAIGGAMSSQGAKDLYTQGKALATGAMQSESGKLATMQLKQAAKDVMSGNTTDALSNMQTAARNLAAVGREAARSEQGKALMANAKNLAGSTAKGAQGNTNQLIADAKLLTDAAKFKVKGNFSKAYSDWMYSKELQVGQGQPLTDADRASLQEVITYWGAR